MQEIEHRYRALLKILTVKEQKFVHEYLTDGNASRAAKVAGYSEKAATSVAWETLRYPDVAAAVDAGIAMFRSRCTATTENLLEELGASAFSNFRHYRIDDEGYLSIEPGAPPSAAKAISSFTRKRIVRKNGDVVYASELRLWNKIDAINLLGKRLRLWVDRVETENAQDAVYRTLLDEIRARQAKGLPPLPEPESKGE